MITRTDQQRKSIEVLCAAYADKLNLAGYDLPTVLAKKVIPVSWTQQAVKDYLFKAIAQAMYNVSSTTKLNIEEVSEVHKHLDVWMDKEFNVSVPFPSNESLSESQRK